LLHAARQLPAWLIFDVRQKVRPAIVSFLILLTGCGPDVVDSPRSVVVVSVADLGRHGERFSGKRVRVRGVWATRMEESRLLPFDRDEKAADIWLEFATTMHEQDPEGRQRADKALLDFNFQRNYSTFYFVQIDCEGIFSWSKNRGFGHLGGSSAQLSIDRVFEANHIQ
jgi:hypothetical protein